jgi:Recombinase
VKRILTHPKYKGSVTYNRTAERLCSKSRRVPASEWIIVPNAFEPLVEPRTFEAAQEVLRQRFWNRSNEQVLEQMKSVLKAHGYLSTALLRSHGLSAGGLNHRFGSLINAYDLIGYQTKYRKTAENRIQIRGIRSELMQQLVSMFPGKVSIVLRGGPRRNCLKLRDGTRVSVRACRSINLVTKGRMWVLQAAKGEPSRLTLMAGMNSHNTCFEEFYVAPGFANHSKIHIAASCEWLREGIHLQDLTCFCKAVETLKSASRAR